MEIVTQERIPLERVINLERLVLQKCSFWKFSTFIHSLISPVSISITISKSPPTLWCLLKLSIYFTNGWHGESKNVLRFSRLKVIFISGIQLYLRDSWISSPLTTLQTQNVILLFTNSINKVMHSIFQIVHFFFCYFTESDIIFQNNDSKLSRDKGFCAI